MFSFVASLNWSFGLSGLDFLLTQTAGRVEPGFAGGAADSANLRKALISGLYQSREAAFELSSPPQYVYYAKPNLSPIQTS